jgi:hypothetical protein
MSEEAPLSIAIWLPALACVSLIVYLLLQRTSSSADRSAERLALLVGARRAWGESDASLRHRSIALSRWPYKQEEPVLAWWARLWWRIWRRRGR